MPAALDPARAAALDSGRDPYLLTVTPDLQPHCRVVTVTWEPDRVIVAPRPRDWPDTAARGHRRVTLLWPPGEPGGYSLILDGEATGEEALAVTPTRVVLHRPGEPAGPGGSSCGSDCVTLYP